MLTEIHRFVNWVRRRNPNAHTWHDHRADPGNSSSPSPKSSNTTRRDPPSHEWGGLRVGLPSVNNETCDALPQVRRPGCSVRTPYLTTVAT
jgi:hypothetical protein